MPSSREPTRAGPRDRRGLRCGRRQRADLCARTRRCSRGAADRWRRGAATAQVVEADAADVSNPTTSRDWLRRAVAMFPQVHILVNNAGVYGPLGPIEEVDWTAWVRAMEINIYGSVLPCRALAAALQAARLRQDRPALRRRRDQSAAAHQRLCRVEGGHRALRRVAGARSQDFRHRRECDRSRRANTRMMDEVLAAGPDAVGRDFYERMVKTKETGRHTARARRGAGRVSRIGGERRHHRPPAERGLGSVGRPCRATATTSIGSDVYTLRRIVPKDRGFTWGDR